MTENEAKIFIQNAMEQSRNVLAELMLIMPKVFAVRKKSLCEYYSNLENCKKEIQSCEVAVKALEEVQQYRTIGTPEECQAAVEKQTAKRALHQGCYDKNGEWHEWNGINGKPYELCPSCRVNLCCETSLDIKPKYCKNCGQKLDWRDKK